MPNSTSGVPERDTRPFFYISEQYFDLFTIASLSNRAIRVHIELICRYTNHATPELLTAEDLAVMPHRAIRELRRNGLLFEDESTTGAFHLSAYVDDVQIFRPGPRAIGRKAIPLAVREFVYDRDGRACLHCGATEPLSLDHIHPWSLGGSDDPENLQTLCRPCNSRKGAKLNHVVQGR